MNSLTKMCNALVTINNILQRRKQEKQNSTMESTKIEKPICKTDTMSLFNIHQMDIQSSKIHSKNSVIEEDIFRMPLSYQRIHELPNIDAHDIEQLRMVDVNTMQDLLGCYLIHDTPDEFRNFLIKIYYLTEKPATIITQFLYQWTRYHLDGVIDNSKSDVFR